MEKPHAASSSLEASQPRLCAVAADLKCRCREALGQRDTTRRCTPCLVVRSFCRGRPARAPVEEGQAGGPGRRLPGKIFRPACDVILNPFDVRSAKWNPLRDVDNAYEAALLAKAPILGDGAWNSYARTLPGLPWQWPDGSAALSSRVGAREVNPSCSPRSLI